MLLRHLVHLLLVAAALPAQSASQPTSAPAPRGTLVVLNKNDHDVSLIDAVSGETRKRIPVGMGPHEAVAAPDGKTVVVCNYGAQVPGQTLSILDVAKQELRATIDLAPYRRPHGIQISNDGRDVAVTAEMDQKLLIVDLAQQKVTRTVPTAARISHMVVLAADEKRAYVTNIASGSVCVLDLGAGKHVKEIPTDKGCEGIALRPGAPELWVTNRAADTLSVIDTDRLEVVAKLACGKFPLRIAFTPDGRHALVACTNSNEIALFDAKERKELRRIALEPGAAPAGILIPPDGTRAYVAQMQRNSLAEIETTTWRVLREIATGNVPDGMAWVR